jgi:predicted ester cyclase
MRRWADGLSRGDPAIVTETCAPDWASRLGGYEPAKRYLREWFGAFPDGRWTITDLIAEGDMVATAWTFTGRNTGAFQGHAATGKAVTLKGVWIDLIKDGQFVGTPQAIEDRFGWMTELGIVEGS